MNEPLPPQEPLVASAPDHPSLTLRLPDEFVAFCRDRGLAPEEVLTIFMHDLAETGQSGGGEDRQRAKAWFDGLVWPDSPGRSFVIEPRSEHVGGGWRLRLLLDGEESGERVFPVDPGRDPERGGMVWWNALPEGERACWMAKGGNTGRVVDAYRAYLTFLARLDADEEGFLWRMGS